MRFSSSSHHLERTLEPPSFQHILGCDAFGRDLLQTVLRGSAFSLSFAALILVVSCLIALVAGPALVLMPKRAQTWGVHVLEILLAFPSLLISLAWAAIRGPGWSTLFLSLALGILPGLTRLLYVRTRELMSLQYIEAAQAIGAGPARLIRVHLGPHLMRLCLVKAPNLFASSLMAEATLSFLGIGAPIGRDTWGSLLAQGKDYLVEAPHLAIGVGIPLILTVLSLQILSETAYS